MLEIRNTVNQLQEQSLNYCDLCGTESNRQDRDGWFTTRCDSCIGPEWHEEHNRKMKRLAKRNNRS
jgi:hypothetical protein